MTEKAVFFSSPDSTLHTNADGMWPVNYPFPFGFSCCVVNRVQFVDQGFALVLEFLENGAQEITVCSEGVATTIQA